MVSDNFIFLQWIAQNVLKLLISSLIFNVSGVSQATKLTHFNSHSVLQK